MGVARVCAESAAQASRPAAPRANREVRTDIERPSPCLVVIVKIALKQTLTENAAGAESHCTSAMVAKIVRVPAKARLWEQAELAARAVSDESPSKKSTENQTHRSRRSLRTSCLHHPTDHGGGHPQGGVRMEETDGVFNSRSPRHLLPQVSGLVSRRVLRAPDRKTAKGFHSERTLK